MRHDDGYASYEDLKGYRKKTKELEMTLGRTPTDDEIQTETGFDPRVMRDFDIDDEEEKELELLVKVSVANNNLRKIRIAKGFTQKTIAALLGVGHLKYGQIENCRLYPNGELRKKLSEIFGKDESYLFPEWLQIFTERWKKQEREQTVKLSAESLSYNQSLLLEAPQEPWKIMDAAIAKRRVQLAIAKAPLKPRERRILTMRYGLDGDKTQSYEEVGKVFDVNRERVRQLEFNALEKLKPYLDGTLKNIEELPDGNVQEHINYGKKNDVGKNYGIYNGLYIPGRR